MKKIKVVLFKIQKKVLETIEADDINLHQVECMKTNLAIMHGVSFDDVEVDTEEIYVPEIAEFLTVDCNGKLLFRANERAIFVQASGLTPAMDINKEDLYYEFLDLLQKKEYDNAIIFI